MRSPLASLTLHPIPPLARTGCPETHGYLRLCTRTPSFNTHGTRSRVVGHSGRISEFRLGDRRSPEDRHIRARMPGRRDHQATESQLSRLSTKPITQRAVGLVDQVRPFGDLRAKVLLVARERALQAPVVRRSSRLWASHDERKPVLDLGFRSLRLQRTVEDRKGTVGVASPSSQLSLRPEDGFAELLGRCCAGRRCQGIPEFSLRPAIQAKGGQEIERGVLRQPEDPSRAPLGRYLIKQGLRPGDLVHVLSDQKQIFHRAAHHQRHRRPAFKKVVRLSQPFVLDFQVPEERMERLPDSKQVCYAVPNVTSMKLLPTRQYGGRMRGVPGAEAEQAGEIFLVQAPEVSQLRDELDRTWRPCRGVEKCVLTPGTSRLGWRSH